MWADGTDPVGLAVQARLTLAQPGDATLEVSGLGEFGWLEEALDLHEHDGRPVLVCRDLPMTADWIDRPARLSITGDMTGDKTGDSGGDWGGDAGGDVYTGIPTKVVISGRLGRAAGTHPAGTVTLELSVEQVMVTVADPAGSVDREHVLPLPLYWMAGPDPIQSQACAILAHTNAHHEPDLREFAGRCSGLGTDRIASATLTWIDRDGARLVWIDLDGAHEHLICFPTTAQTPAMLGALLSSQLETGDPPVDRLTGELD